MRKVVIAAMTMLPLIGCAAPGQPGSAPPGEVGMNKTTGGALVGAAAGGLVGSQFGSGSGKALATVAGVLLGGLMGSEVGQSLDRADELAMGQATQRTLETGPSGQPYTWRNPDNGHYGTVIPRAAYQRDGMTCREYQQTIVIGGQTQQGYGTACRQPDGSWKIQS